MRSVAKNRSATMPTKNGEIIAATAVVPAARPICAPEKRNVEPSHVPIVTYQAPQMKYCRNIMVESFIRVLVCIFTTASVAMCRVRPLGQTYPDLRAGTQWFGLVRHSDIRP